MQADPGISIESVSKTFPSGLRALETINLAAADGEFVSLVGPSGCGKSTLLRIVAGLTAPSTGECKIASERIPAFVFQEPALLPWRNVEKNAELLMELEGYNRSDRRRRSADALDLVGLSGFEQSYPHALSGGMRMRLSLARSLALHPKVFLMDEPLAAVDELTREILQDELLRLWALEGFTALFVTHNVHEAVYLSNRVVVMSPRPGRIVEIIDVPFSYPRSAELRSEAEFAALTGAVSASLRKET